MTTINRLNATISDHDMAANFVALFLIACISVSSAVAITQSGNQVKSSFNTLLQSIPTVQVPATGTQARKAQTIQQPTTITISAGSGTTPSIQSQPQNIVNQLQPAQNTIYNTATANTLQPSANSVQLTEADTNLQNAVGIQ